MTLNWGYLAGTVLFLSLLFVLVILQIAAKKFYRWLYWETIVASTTAGTTMANFADRSLGIGSYYLSFKIATSGFVWPHRGDLPAQKLRTDNGQVGNRR